MAWSKKLLYLFVVFIAIISYNFVLQYTFTDIMYLPSFVSKAILRKPDISVSSTARTIEQTDLTEHLSIDDIPRISVREVSCAALFDGDVKAIAQAEEYQKQYNFTFPSSKEIQKMTSNCSEFISTRKYITKTQTKMEDEFPIAYGISAYKDIAMLERFLRAIYRPQNYYCIHIDVKAPIDVKNAAASIVKCFDNVFLSSRQTAVRWGTYSVLEATLICMEDLLRLPKWKYFINLTGQEFALRTNLELVKILRVFNGANGMESTDPR